MLRRCLLLLVLLPLAAANVCAEVLDAAPDGFTIRERVVVPVAPAVAWAELIAIGNWWNAQHSYSGDAANLRLRAEVGGCFCEQLPHGGAVEHLRVIYVAPNALLRLRGGLGPLQSIAADGVMSFELKAVEGGTEITLTYAVGGYMKGGIEAWAAPVGGVLAEQLGRLRGRFPG